MTTTVYTCPDAVAVAVPAKTITITPPPGGIQRVCVEDASGYAEVFAYYPAGDVDSVVQLGSGAPIVAYSVNAVRPEAAPTPALPATGLGSSLLVVAAGAVVVGALVRRWAS